ncbi:hypothetical protein HDV05_008591, partial [Chytridiales sp. JEL 0842]
MPTEVILGDLLQMPEIPDTFFQSVSLQHDWAYTSFSSLEFNEIEAVHGYLSKFFHTNIENFVDHWYSTSIPGRRKLIRHILSTDLMKRAPELNLDMNKPTLTSISRITGFDLNILVRGEAHKDMLERSKTGGPSMMDMFVYFINGDLSISANTSLLQMRRLIQQHNFKVRSFEDTTGFVSMVDTTDGRLRFGTFIEPKDRAKVDNTLQALYDARGICSIDEAVYLANEMI